MRRKNQVHSLKVIRDAISLENQKMLERLIDVKPQLIIEKPKQFGHLDDNLKKRTILEMKYTEIERENRILLEKMQIILNKQQDNYLHPTQSIIQKQHGEMIGVNSTKALNKSQLSHYESTSVQLKILPHEIKRKRENERITEENKKMLARLQNKQSQYNVQGWQEQEVKRQGLLRIISQLPYHGNSNNNESTQSQGRNISISQQSIYNEDTYGFTPLKVDQKHFQSSKLSISSNKMHKTSTNPMGVNQNSNSQLQFYSKKPKQLEVDRLVVYKKGFFISLFSMEDENQNKMLEIENQVKTQQILESFNNDYELLSDHIKIVKDQIKIRRPDVSRDITLDLNNTIVEETTANRYEKRIKIQKNHQSQLRNQSRNQTQQLVYTEYDDGDLQQNIDGNKSVDVIKSRPQNLLSGKIIQKNKGNFQSLVRTSNNKQTNLKYMLINNANSSNKNLNSQFSNQRELNQRSQINLLRTNDQNKIMKIPQIIPPLSLNQLSNTQIQLTNMKDNPSQNYQELSYKTQQVLQDTNMNATFSINQKHKSVNDQMSTTFSNNLPLASIHKQSTLQNPANQFNIIEKKDSQDSYETPPTQIDFTIRDQTNQKENTTGVAFGQVILGDSESYENDEFIEETILTKEKQSLQNQRSLRYQQDSIRYEDQKKDRFQQSNTSKFRDRLNLKEYALQQPDQNEVKTESQLESLQSNDIIKNYGLDNKEEDEEVQEEIDVEYDQEFDQYEDEGDSKD